MTLQFPAPDWSVLADGAGTLYIIDTGNRKESQTWTVSNMTPYSSLLLIGRFWLMGQEQMYLIDTRNRRDLNEQ